MNNQAPSSRISTLPVMIMMMVIATVTRTVAKVIEVKEISTRKVHSMENLVCWLSIS